MPFDLNYELRNIPRCEQYDPKTGERFQSWDSAMMHYDLHRLPNAPTTPVPPQVQP